MVIPMLIITSVFTVAEGPKVLSTSELLTEANELYEKTLEGKQGPLTVRCRVGSVRSQKTTDPANRTYEQFILYPVNGESKEGSFYVVISPKAEKALKRLGLSDLRKHFTGKEIEIRGKLNATYLTIYASPAVLMYHIDITNLKQIRLVDDLSSKRSSL